MKTLRAVLGLLVLSIGMVQAEPPGKSSALVVNAQNAGPTPFISVLTLAVDPTRTLQAVSFSIAPKPGSVTRTISATYSRNYLLARGYLSVGGLQLFLPVFGLYANYANTVTITSSFTDGVPIVQRVTVPTLPFSDPCGFNNRTVIQSRTASRSLSYDFILAKNNCGVNSPTILDTDGEIRWVGTAGLVYQPSTVFQNAIYLGVGPTLYRMEFDGAVSLPATYPGVSFQHNIDYGRQGMVLDEDFPGNLESFNAEVDGSGNVLKTWDLAAIISNAMIAGGDDPGQFVFPSSPDWFHNNAVAYRKSDDSLIVSSRENFVIALDYDSGAIKWILGDPTKKWFQFPSLRRYALALSANSLPPIGQHAVSITADDKLLLFDDGQNSLLQNPPGTERSYSAPRKYDLDLTAKVATEIWNYPNGGSLFSPYCSSIYEDLPSNYLVDYAIITNLGASQFMELLGLDSVGGKVFDYRYNSSNCQLAWNSQPIHLEAMKFTTVVPLSVVSRKGQGTAGPFDLPLSLNGAPGIEPRSGGTGATYRLIFTFPLPVTVAGATVTPAPGKTAAISGSPNVQGRKVTVNLKNVSDAQTIVVNLLGTSDGLASDTVSVPMTVLVGDTNGSGSVNSSDTGQTSAQAGRPVTAANYREDVTANGVINSSDIALVKSLSGTGVAVP